MKWVAPRGVGKTTLIVKFVDEIVKTDKFTSTLGPSPYVFSSVQAIRVGFRQSSCRHWLQDKDALDERLEVQHVRRGQKLWLSMIQKCTNCVEFTIHLSPILTFILVPGFWPSPAWMLQWHCLAGKRVKLQIWDTAGQERFQTITQQQAPQRDFFPRPINIHLPAANGMWNQDSRNLLQTNLWDRQQFECSRNSPFFGACWKYSCYTWALLNNGCFLGFPPKSRTFRSFPWANQPFQLRILATAFLAVDEIAWLALHLDVFGASGAVYHLYPVTRYYRSAMGILMVYDVTSEVWSSIPNWFGFCLPFGGQAWQ